MGSQAVATELNRVAGEQIATLISAIANGGRAGLEMPCPGREKLGDGAVGTVALHVADNYHRIAALAAGRAPEPTQHLHGDEQMVTAELLLARLTSALVAFGIVAELDAERLSSTPPAGFMRFCDGQRTLGQVLTALLRHQQHQVDAIIAADPGRA